MDNHSYIPDPINPDVHSEFMAESWGKVALDFIFAGNVGAAAFAARSAAVHAFHVLGGG